MDFDKMMEDVMENVEQYAKQRVQGVSFEKAQATMQLRRALEKNDVDVDEVRYIGQDPSLMYYHEDGEKTSEVVTIALVAAKATGYIPNVLAVTALESETERHAHFSVERDWLNQYNDGEINKKTLSKRTLNTWKMY
jgi:hypothetical protein